MSLTRHPVQGSVCLKAWYLPMRYNSICAKVALCSLEQQMTSIKASRLLNLLQGSSVCGHSSDSSTSGRMPSSLRITLSVCSREGSKTNSSGLISPVRLGRLLPFCARAVPFGVRVCHKYLSILNVTRDWWHTFEVLSRRGEALDDFRGRRMSDWSVIMGFVSLRTCAVCGATCAHAPYVALIKIRRISIPSNPWRTTSYRSTSQFILIMCPAETWVDDNIRNGGMPSGWAENTVVGSDGVGVSVIVDVIIHRVVQFLIFGNKGRVWQFGVHQHADGMVVWKIWKRSKHGYGMALGMEESSKIRRARIIVDIAIDYLS